MLEIFSLKETAKEVIKSPDFFTEVNKKFTPNELLAKADSNVLSGDLNEKNAIQKEVLDKNKINEDSDYSEKINESIRSPLELQVYQNASLEEGLVNDRATLKSTDIDASLKNSMGRSNLELMDKGLAPIDNFGDKYNLHHIGQKMDSPLAELQGGEHRIYHKTLHDTSLDKSSIDRGTFDIGRSAHWKARAEEIRGNQHV